MSTKLPDNISNILQANIEACDELDNSYRNREAYENGEDGTVEGFFFYADTVRRWLPDYDGGTLLLNAQHGGVREADFDDIDKQPFFMDEENYIEKAIREYRESRIQAWWNSYRDLT